MRAGREGTAAVEGEGESLIERQSGPFPAGNDGGERHLLHTGLARGELESTRHYATLTDEQAVFAARDIWHSVNRPNLIENILPTRPRATLVLRKDADHAINRLRLRKL